MMKHFTSDIQLSRILMLAIFACFSICSWADDFEPGGNSDPLKYWWDTENSCYNIGDITNPEDEGTILYTVYEALTALQSINNATDIGNYAGQTFNFNQDIDFSEGEGHDYDTEHDGNWIPLGTSEHPFEGIISGSCEISNMVVDGNYANAGFIGVQGCNALSNITEYSITEIGGFTFDNCSVTGTENAGMFVGSCPYVYGIKHTWTFSNIEVNGGSVSAPCAGGIIGNIGQGACIDALTVYGTSITGGSDNGYAGGLIGYVDYHAEISAENYSIRGSVYKKNSREDDDESSANFIAALVDNATNDMLTVTLELYYPDDEHSTITVTGKNTNCFFNINKQAVLDAGADADNSSDWIDYQDYLPEIFSDSPSPSTKSLDLEGNGKEEDPYIVSSNEELAKLAELFSESSDISQYTDLAEDGFDSFDDLEGCYFKQTKNIDYSGDDSTPTSTIGTSTHPFVGHYDGGAHSITGKAFGYVGNATIQNIIVLNAPVIENAGANEGTTTVYDAYGLYADTDPGCDNFYKLSAPAENGECTGGGTNGEYYSITSLEGLGTEANPFKVYKMGDLELNFTTTVAQYLKSIILDGIHFQLMNDICDQEDIILDMDRELPYGTNLTSTIENYDSDDSYINGNYLIATINGNGHVFYGLMRGIKANKVCFKNTGFVNCYNHDDTSSKLITVQGNRFVNCYADATVTLKYNHLYTSYYTKDNNLVYYGEDGNETTPSEGAVWTKDTYSFDGHFILKNHAITLTGDDGKSYTTDYNTTTSDRNVIAIYDASKNNNKEASSVIMSKPNIRVDNEIKNLQITDITMLDYSSKGYPTDEQILSTDFVFNGKGVVKNACYKRAAHNKYESVSLPFAFSYNNIQISSDCKVYEYYSGGDNTPTEDGFDDSKDSYEETPNGRLCFVDVLSQYAKSGKEFSAGQPLLFTSSGNSPIKIKVSSETGIDIITDVDLSVKNNFVGAVKTQCDDLTKRGYDVYKFSGSNNELLLCNQYSWIYPFRSYIRVNTGTYKDAGVQSSAKSVLFSLFDDIEETPTVINMTTVQPEQAITGDVYTLDGRKVSANGTEGLKAGLYITNGKKISVK